ncbi:hypothetical protein LXA43DRAFT_1041239 [Ganoderma leucocontextum]|nr:hypothetical protein LXA43DRAFT_1041239 [Ganoderma leucocontextum]
MATTACPTNMQELAEALRSHIERRAHSTMSSESIAGVANLLTELAATLREDLNTRVPFFQCPFEILQQILEHVPDPLSESHSVFQPSWHSSAMDTSMLTPVLQTCRQLRRIALSHMSLWKTISPAPQYALPPILLQKGCDIPLIAIIDGTLGDGVMGNLDEVEVQRMQELHVFDLHIHRLLELEGDDIIAKIRRCFGAGLPLLESLSITNDEDEEDEVEGDIDEDECPFPLDDAPRLRYMTLQSVTFVPTNTFPHLTHLALSKVDTPECHMEIAGLLSRCPNLEGLAIRYPLMDLDMDLPERHPHPLPLNRLRRVTLQLPQFCDPVMEFYLSLFPLDHWVLPPTALQILELNIKDNASQQLGEMLVRVAKAEASHLALSLHPHPKNYRKHLTITAAGPTGTFHVSTESFRGVDVDAERREGLDVSPEPFLDSILCDCVHLRAVREVWVTGMPPQAGRRPYRDATEHFKSTIAALPALETIVFVVTAVGPQLEVDLCLCPSAHDPGFASSNLKTLRIVYGSDTHAGRGSVEKIRLRKLLDQVGTGAYGYFENVLLQMTRRLVVYGKDFARLKARFPTVTFQHIDSIPTMPLPEYCTEPYAGPGGSSTWHGSLW